MIRLNNKGQSLVIFIIFIPVVIMLGMVVVDVCFARYNKIRLENINKEVIKYGLSHINEEPYNNMVDMIYQNDSEIDDYKIDINSDDETINVTLLKSTKGFFGSILDKEIYKEKCSNLGYIKENKIMIEKKAIK